MICLSRILILIEIQEHGNLPKLTNKRGFLSVKEALYPRSGVVDPDPHSFWSAESGSRRAKKAHKSEEISSFEVLDVLF